MEKPMKNELIITECIAHTMVIDTEGDPLHCTSDEVGLVKIDTTSWDYLPLTRANLEVLLRLMDEADNYYQAPLATNLC